MLGLLYFFGFVAVQRHARRGGLQGSHGVELDGPSGRIFIFGPGGDGAEKCEQ